MNIKNILFDLDGTIIKSDKGIIKSILLSLEEIGIKENDIEKLKAFLGPPLYDSYKKYYGISDEDYEKALDVFHEYYRLKGIFECELYPNVEETLKTLNEKGYNLFLATSKPEIEAKRIILYFGLDKYFKFIGGSDGDRGGKRSNKTAVIKYVLNENNIIDVNECIMVGDRYHDIEGAKNLGIKSVAVLYGYGSIEEFKEYEADIIIEDIKDLIEEIKS